jgi:3-deoxy-D-manno-octulosonic-acid transferase
MLVRLLSPLLLAHLCWRSLRDGGWRYFCQRLGFSASVTAAFATAAKGQSLYWFHAASVGEVLTLMPLIEALSTRDPGCTILLTTNTPTGAQVLEERAAPGVVHAYLPIDFAGATQRFIRRLPVAAVWVVETEIWPWLYARCHQHDIRLTIINARTSKRTQRNEKGLLASTYRRALSDVHVLARSAADAENFTRLGADAARIQVAGNLKFANNQPATRLTPLTNLPYCVAASTHADEELQLARAWLEEKIDSLLVIVPRHIERGTTIVRQLRDLQRELAPDAPDVVLRSNGAEAVPEARLYVADTLGALHAWYAFSTAVFVGGSLIDRGGHNVLEPAWLGKPVVVGQHMQNFADALQVLQQHDAIIVAASAANVVNQLQLAVDGNVETAQLGERARDAARQSGDVLVGYLDALLS